MGRLKMCEGGYQNSCFLDEWSSRFTFLLPLLITCSPSSNIFCPQLDTSFYTLHMFKTCQSWAAACFLSAPLFYLLCIVAAHGPSLLTFFTLNKPEQHDSWPEAIQGSEKAGSLFALPIYMKSLLSWVDTSYQKHIKDEDSASACLLTL